MNINKVNNKISYMQDSDADSRINLFWFKYIDLRVLIVLYP
jgi:hypothetical protein